jgi:uncharacterized integral membrane protein
MRRVLTLVIVVPLALVIIAFAVANRQSVTVSFDPFSTADPAYSSTLPLFILIFFLVILGVVVGGAASWLRQSKWRRAARKLDAENRRLFQELAAARHRVIAEPARAPDSPVKSDARLDMVPAISPPGR